MPKKDPRIDAYIAKASAFAQPILEHVRQIVHKADPRIEETMKWGHPHFTYKGLVCGLSAFKEHCGLGFWRGSEIYPDDPKALKAGPSAGSFGKIQALKDLPSDAALTKYVRMAVSLNEGGVPRPAKPRKAPKPVIVPPALKAALAKNAKAKATFDDGSPSFQREYAEWVGEAKTDETRDRRVATTLEWLTEGKSRNWKYKNG